jgi:Fe-S oxidoreductase
MATYKAEFLSHYYENRFRPRHAYSMGLIYWWARLAALMPGLVNALTHTPVIGDAIKFIGGIAPERRLPIFAAQTFTRWFHSRAPRNAGRARVILWPDTFNDNFFPEVCRAAVEVLEAAGFQVSVPHRSLCCGRPLYDFGMLDTAKRLLREILDALRPEIEAGVPVIGLEPSCVAVFRDEMTNLFPDDQDARRLKDNTYLFSEFVDVMLDGYQPPQLRRKALVHGHCHQKALMGMDHEKAIFSKLGLEYEVLDSGCCGMAGSFGFAKGHYEISMMIGERVLLPAVRRASSATMIIADGFSCREQIRQGTNREALHTAQVLQLALKEAAAPIGYPERAFMERKIGRRAAAAQRRLAWAGGAVAAALLTVWARNSRRSRL